MSTDYYKDKKVVADYIAQAADVNGALLIKRLREYLPPSSKILELGSGPGTDWVLLQEVYEAVGSDHSPDFLEHLKSSYPQGIFLEIDAATIAIQQFFDAIYSNKVLHHLTKDELQASLTRQHEILNADGIICHSFWKGSGHEYFNGMYVKYHDQKSLSKLLNGLFDILLLVAYAEFETDDSLLLIARRK